MKKFKEIILLLLAIGQTQDFTSRIEDSKVPFLWEIDTNPPSYFFRVQHVPYKRVWDAVPENVMDAFEKSERIYVEFDPKDGKNNKNCYLLPSGLHLSQILPRKLYLRISQYLENVKSDMHKWFTFEDSPENLRSMADYVFKMLTDNWGHKRPIWIYILMTEYLTKNSFKNYRPESTEEVVPVVDQYLIELAKTRGKKVKGIEVAADQCQAFTGIDSTLVEAILNKNLNDAEEFGVGFSRVSATLDDLIFDYCKGNFDSTMSNLFPIADSYNTEEERLVNEFYKMLKENNLIKRNSNMATRVVNLLNNNPTKSFFFAFGAAHFLGEDSVIAMVRSQGFKVRKVPADEIFKKK